MDMDQDSEEEKQQYLALALHLASEFFLRNPNKDVRLLVACCLADIFRIYAPEAPYTSHDKLKVLYELLKIPAAHDWKLKILHILRRCLYTSNLNQHTNCINLHVFFLGNLPFHYTTVEGIRGHQEPSVQQILLLAGGEKF